MPRRVLCGLVGAVVGTVTTLLVWWAILALFALIAQEPGRLAPRAVAQTLRTLLGAMLLLLPAPLGLIQGALVAAMRGRIDRGVLLEVVWSPFAWVLVAGEGTLGGFVLLLSLVPGWCVGMLVGGLVGGEAELAPRLPAGMVVGGMVGVVLTLLVLNLCVQWPGLRQSGQKHTEPPQTTANS
jgi:hypothetical protein